MHVIGAPGGELRLTGADLARIAAAAGLAGAAVHVRVLQPAGARAAVDDGRPMYPASMIKTPLAIATALAVDAGRLRLDRAVTVATANMTFTDAPSPLVPGYVASVAELLELMLCRSDNVATNVLYDVLGRGRATADVAAFGLERTAFRRKLSGRLPLIDDPEATGRNAHPASEAADAFERIARGTVPSAALLQRLLAAQLWNSKLSAGLEPGDRFAHKTGDTDDASHDGGILELAGGARFVLVVYTERASNDDTDACFATFMRALRPLLEKESAHARVDSPE